MFLKNLLIGLILAFCLAEFCEGIQCYKCQSDQNPLCGEDNFSKGKNPKVIDCTKQPPPASLANQAKAPTKCSKIVLKDNVGTIVKRDCHWERVGDSSPGCYIEPGLRLEKCESCTGDLCNAAPKSIATSFGIVTTVLLTVARALLY